jgi:hypothetical protein
VLGILNPYKWLMAVGLVIAVVGTGYVQHLRLATAQSEARLAAERAAAAEASAQATRELLDKYTAQVESIARRQEAAAKVRVRTQSATAAIMSNVPGDKEALEMAKAQAAQWEAGDAR